MLITDKKELSEFSVKHRLWQGIPGIEVTAGGRIFSVCYSGGTKEDIGNFVPLCISDDGGESFSDPVAVAYREGGRCYDPVVWIDPIGRLWMIWAYASVSEGGGVYASVCQNPDGDELSWSDVFEIGKLVMMNKPTVLSTGEWLFPIAVWKPELKMPALPLEDYGHKAEPTGAFVYRTSDQGKSFTKLGGTCAPVRSFDEHMTVELKDGSLMMLIRTSYGIAVSYSYDQGRSWTDAVNSGIKGPCSRFFIRRLRSGRILLINHLNFTGRNNLAALLSEDEGKSWKYSLMLDERDNSSYPDAIEAEDGFIYVTYDRERGGFRHSMKDVMGDAREILMAKITEEDIIAGKIINAKSKLKVTISKLKEYEGEENPYKEIRKYSDVDLAKWICESEGHGGISALFEHYPIACENMKDVDVCRLDELYEAVSEGRGDRFSQVLEMVRLIREVGVDGKAQMPLVEAVKRVLCEDEMSCMSVGEVAARFSVSKYYLMHSFKRQTGITVPEYRTALQMMRAKLLLAEEGRSIGDIAVLCGFESREYFSRVFKKREGISPVGYRNIHRKRVEKGDK